MKKYFLIGIFIFFGLTHEIPLFAGTLSAGVQSWYVWWDSGLAKMNAQTVENQIRKELEQGQLDVSGDFLGYQGFEVGDPVSSGFIYGPVFSYKTEDKVWDIRASLMWFGSYSTSVDSTVTLTGSFPFVGSVSMPFAIKTDLEIKYKDLDLRVKRMFTENLGLFGGYMFQSYTSEFDSNYNFAFSTLSMNSVMNFKLDAQMHMLYAGLSGESSIGSMFAVNGNIGLGTPVAGKVKQNMTVSGNYFNNDISNSGGEIKAALMMFGEVSGSMKIAEMVRLDLGYQYRRLTVKVEKLDLNADGIANESKNETDIFHGVTFAASYLVNL